MKTKWLRPLIIGATLSKHSVARRRERNNAKNAKVA
jgi:hypothetical protein